MIPEAKASPRDATGCVEMQDSKGNKSENMQLAGLQAWPGGLVHKTHPAMEDVLGAVKRQAEKRA